MFKISLKNTSKDYACLSGGSIIKHYNCQQFEDFFNAIIFNHFLKTWLLFFVSVHSILIYNKVNIIVFWAVTVHSYTDLPPSRLRDGSFKHAISKIK